MRKIVIKPIPSTSAAIKEQAQQLWGRMAEYYSSIDTGSSPGSKTGLHRTFSKTRSISSGTIGKFELVQLADETFNSFIGLRFQRETKKQKVRQALVLPLDIVNKKAAWRAIVKFFEDGKFPEMLKKQAMFLKTHKEVRSPQNMRRLEIKISIPPDREGKFLSFDSNLI